MSPDLRLLAVALSASLAAANPQQPAPTDPATASSSVAWNHGDIQDSLTAAEGANRQVLVYFWMNGSAHCTNLWGQTLTQPAAGAELGHFVCHGADATTETGAKLVQRYGVTTLPTLLVVDPKGTANDAMIGFVPLTAFVTEMQRIRAGTGTVASLRAAADAAPDNLNARFQLGQKLMFVGDKAGGDAIFDSIRRDDPDGTTAPGAELLLFDVRERIVKNAPDKNDPATWDLEPMYGRLKKTKQPVVLWKGWNWLAQIEGQCGRPAQQVAAWRAAWPHAPDVSLDEWAAELLSQLWERRDAAKTKDRLLARDIAKVLGERDGKKIDAAAANVEQRTFVLSAAAKGMSIGGRRSNALALLKRAKTLAPDDRELDQLEQQIKR